jgi:hypothetical protein
MTGKHIALLAFVLLAGCASNSIVQSNTYVNQPGDPIEITVEGLDVKQAFAGEQSFAMQVVVANNSDLDVTVTNLGVFQNSVGGGLIVQPVNAAYDVTIEPAKEHPFEVALRATRAGENSAMSSYNTPVIALRIVVTLSNGDRYIQEFAIPVREN